MNFSRAFVVQFWASRYIMHQNRTSVWQVMTIWISREHSMFNFERLDILCTRIRLPCDKFWSFEFLESIRSSISSVLIYYAPESYFRVISYDHLNLSRAFDFKFWASRYVIRKNRTSVWHDHLNFSRAFVVQFRASRYIMRLNQTFVWQVMTIWISREHSLYNI